MNTIRTLAEFQLNGTPPQDLYMLNLLLNHKITEKALTSGQKELVAKFLRKDAMTDEEVITLAYFAKIALGTNSDPLEQTMLKAMSKPAQAN